MERLLAKVPQLLRSHHQLSAKPYANVIFVAFCTSQTLEDKMATNDWKSKTSLHEFSAKDIDGNEVSMSKYAGHPTIIVNVATQCGLTKSNYKQLNELFDKYEKDGLRIAAFPCNQFGNQEPGCSVDIKEFITKNGVRFDMYEKVEVNGGNAHPLWKWLKDKKGGLLGIDAIKWNFTKFLVDKDGKPVKRFGPTDEPSKIEPDIKKLL